MANQICLTCLGREVLFKDTHRQPPKIIPLGEELEFPFSSIASVSHNFTYVGSAFLVSSKLVLTAGHVFTQQNYQSESEFSVNFKGGEVLAEIFKIHFHPKLDLALGVLSDDVGMSSFYFGSPLVGQKIMVVGFPSQGFGIQQYYGNGVVKRIEGDVLVHDASTRDGHSGSPIMLLDKANVVIGVHSEALNGEDENAGLVCNGEVVSWINSHS